MLRGCSVEPLQSFKGKTCISAPFSELDKSMRNITSFYDNIVIRIHEKLVLFDLELNKI